MKIVVFGSTGMIGSRISEELVNRGHEVVHASRAAGVDVTDPDAVATVAAGADAIVSAVATRGVDYTLLDVARSLTAGAKRAEVRRLVVVGGAASLETAPGVRLIDSPDFPDEYRDEANQAIDSLEFYRGVEDLDWTFVSPALVIQPGDRTGSYRLGADSLLVDDSGNSEISAEDYAIAIADLIEQDSHLHERVGVAW